MLKIEVQYNSCLIPSEKHMQLSMQAVINNWCYGYKTYKHTLSTALRHCNQVTQNYGFTEKDDLSVHAPLCSRYIMLFLSVHSCVHLCEWARCLQCADVSICLDATTVWGSAVSHALTQEPNNNFS